MKVTLNKANKLRGLLETTIRHLYNRCNDYREITLTGHENVQRIKEKISANINDNQALLDQIVRGEQAIFALRNLIQERNLKSGINKLISEIALQNTLMHLYGRWTDNHVKIFTDDINVNEVVRMNCASLVNGNLSLPYLKLYTLDRGQIESHKEKLIEIKKTLRELEEKRNELNHKTLIEIPTEIVEVLKENNLI